MRTLVLIDGQNLYHSAKRAWGSITTTGAWRYRYPSFDVVSLANELARQEPRRTLTETRFYTGLHGTKSKGRDQSWRGFWLNKTAAMRTQGVHVYEGRVNRAGQEKGVDVSIAVDLIQATHGMCYDSAIIVSRDSDFEPAVKLAKRIADSQERSIEIESAFPQTPTTKQQRGIPGTIWRPIDQSTYDRSLDLNNGVVPKLFTYVVYHDTGLAPNPYHGYCTIACCKPHIRRTAQVGDWIVGIGSVSKGRGGKAVFAMQVIETMPFEDFWDDSRFEAKRPRIDAGPIEVAGDNIYHRKRRAWVQLPSLHSNPDGGQCSSEMEEDLRVNRVLIGEAFTYWGGVGPSLPYFAGERLFAGRGHKFKYRPEVVAEFLEWYDQLGTQGVLGEPADLATAEAHRADLLRSQVAN